MIKYISTIVIATLIFTSAIKAQIIFPEIKGWEKSEDIQTYDKNNLWEYINGAASYYLKYGFEKLEIREYFLSPNEYISVEIYHHQSPLLTFGIYAFERPYASQFLEIGAEGYREESTLNFYGDTLYIKTIASKNTPESIKAINLIAQNIAKQYMPTAHKPINLNSFPNENKMTYCEKFFPRNYLGHDFLHNALETSYLVDNEKIKLFIINCKNKEEKKLIRQAYFKFANIKPRIKDKRIYEVNDMFNGLVMFFEKDNSIYGVSGTENEDLAKEYLKKLM